jgi:ABC-type uncharacterized transport system auxiliary subunit
MTGHLHCRAGRHAPPLLALLTAAALALPLLPGCGATPQRRYYTLSYPLTSDRVTASRPPLHPVRLRIRPFAVALPYDRPQMVYRQSPYEFNYDSYRLWASKPQHMLRELVEDHLEAARLVAEVTREFGDQPPDYELAAEVLALEEYDAGDAWYGHLAMRISLVRFGDQSVLWTHEFDRKHRVQNQQPVLIVRALSEILREEMKRVTADLDRVLSLDRGVQATLPMPPPPPDEGAPEPPVTTAPAPAARPLPPPRGGAEPLPPAPPSPLIVPDEEGAR